MYKILDFINFHILIINVLIFTCLVNNIMIKIPLIVRRNRRKRLFINLSSCTFLLLIEVVFLVANVININEGTRLFRLFFLGIILCNIHKKWICMFGKDFGRNLGCVLFILGEVAFSCLLFQK